MQQSDIFKSYFLKVCKYGAPLAIVLMLVYILASGRGALFWITVVVLGVPGSYLFLKGLVWDIAVTWHDGKFYSEKKHREEDEKGGE